MSAQRRRKAREIRRRTSIFRPSTFGPAQPARKFVSANIPAATSASRCPPQRVLLVAPSPRGKADQLATSPVVPRLPHRSHPATFFPSPPASSTRPVRKTHRHNRDHAVREPTQDARTARRLCSWGRPPLARVRSRLPNRKEPRLISGASRNLSPQRTRRPRTKTNQERWNALSLARWHWPVR